MVTQTDEQKQISTLYQLPSGNYAQKALFIPTVSILRTALQALITGSTVADNTIYNITDAVGDTAVIQVDGQGTNTISSGAINVTTKQRGTYDITTDIFTPNT